jgi:PKD repeat protein
MKKTSLFIFLLSLAMIVVNVQETPLTASFRWSANKLTISFNANSSKGSIASYLWDFGDGGSGTGVAPIHKYKVQGTYAVVLTVRDSAGLQSSLTQQLKASKCGYN